MWADDPQNVKFGLYGEAHASGPTDTWLLEEAQALKAERIPLWFVWCLCTHTFCTTNCCDLTQSCFHKDVWPKT